ncbi:family 43 glycosylhydrolase [uncultured Croceitalea sp.]|uniref:family 43 glycosylhydrolase n=1 Tax=uncultured Croceitalea sp. TaxID=1798908 RepID=UPI00330688CF
MNVYFRKVISALLFCYPLFLIAQKIAVDNTMPRRDESGQIVDAHDGRIIQFGTTFYWYGTAYGNTNGFTVQNQYRCYSSKDLVNWKYEGKLLENQPEGIYYRPHVIYNEKTGQYVLWYNWYPELWNGQFGVASSDSPQGPFKIADENVQMYHSEIGLGDFGLFVDDDGTGYISYNTIQNHKVSVEKLNDDYLSSTLENGGFISEHMEAGTMFKKDGKYYLLTDYTCCFCNYGSGARVYVSNDPMKGYELNGNINRYPGRPSSVLNDEIVTGTLYETLSRTEDAFEAVQIDFTGTTQVHMLKIHLFTGNRPENCGDVNNPRVHPKIQIPTFNIYEKKHGKWSDVKTTLQNIQQSASKSELTLTLEGSAANSIKIQPSVTNYSFYNLYINELEVIEKEKPETKLIDFKAFVIGKKIMQQPIIPAQQTYVMKLNTNKGEAYIWMGDLWGSASDHIKGHDYQYWSAPLQFHLDGAIKPMQWTDSWSVELKKN